MSVSSQTPINSSTGNGVTTSFPYTFKIISEDDLQVLVDGTEITSGFTVSGVGNDGGGAVVFSTAPANGALVVRKRAMSYARSNAFQEGGDLLADTLNDDQDAPVLMIQQLAEEVGRCLKVGPGETPPGYVDPGGSAGPVDLSGSTLTGAVPLKFEGATDNAFETSLAITDPTADRTITVQDKSGTLALTNSETFTGVTVVSKAFFDGAGNYSFYDNAQTKRVVISHDGTTGKISSNSSSDPLLVESYDDLTLQSTTGGAYINANGEFIVELDSEQRFKIDSIGVSVLQVGGPPKPFISGEGIEVTGGTLGYGAGAGGTVTQLTSKSTPVTLNKSSGKITMHNANLAAGAIVVFAVTNSNVSAEDVVHITINFANGQNYDCGAYEYGSGSFNVWVKNQSAGPLAEAVVLNFVVLSGATS